MKEWKILNTSKNRYDDTISEIESQIASLREKSKKYTHRLSSIENRKSASERKARTHRLIQIGALTDKYLNTGELTPERFEVLLAAIVKIKAVKKLLPEVPFAETPAERE
jgi:chromosome segregation ATPase